MGEMIKAALAQTSGAQFWLLFAIVFVAFAVKSLTGFGNTLVVNGAFAFLKENRFTTPVELLWNVPTNAWLAWKERRYIDFKLVAPLCVFVVIGDALGIWLLKSSGDAVLRTSLGLILIALAAEMLFNKATIKPGPLLSVSVALASGILCGLFGIGAVIATWLNRLSKGKEAARSNICFVFSVDNLFRTVIYGFSGILTTEIIGFSLMLSPAIVLGLAAGRIIDRRLDAEAVKRITIGLLLLSGVAIAVKYRFGM